MEDQGEGAQNSSAQSFNIEILKKEPYIGPRPFTGDKEDQARFFGRKTETDEIISLIISHRLILVYAQVGNW